ncbi:hypothetical protein BGZ96_005711 [Linnemannia gamsii]|uniref:Uncharacterized protein n=1 Tax=Linnemannia gamsii TaxID=64522 RepID=A0ABQ7K3J9_9FUNG|nr:hypothetical protein BGZ96_005711 [Linnemannia gamsii]
MAITFAIGRRSDATGRRARITFPIYMMDWDSLTDRDIQVIRFRVFTHNILYLFFVVSMALTFGYQAYLPALQLKCRNWIGLFLPIFTGMSDPRVGFLHEASAPILFVAWMALASEWYTATTDTKFVKVRGYSAIEVVYAERVGCAYGSKACDILFWYLAMLYCTSLCFFAELVYIIWVQHREQWRAFFVNQFDCVCLRFGFRRNTASTTTAGGAAADPEEIYDLGAYGYPSVGTSGSAATNHQSSSQLDILRFPNPPSHPPPDFPHNLSQTNSSASLPTHALENVFVLGQDGDEDVTASTDFGPATLQGHQAPRDRNQASISDEIKVLEHLPTTVDEIEVLQYLSTTDVSHPLYKEIEGSVILSIPARIDTPHPIKKSSPSVAQIIGLNMTASGSESRSDTPYPHHLRYVPRVPLEAQVLTLNSIEYHQDPRSIIEAAVQHTTQMETQSLSSQPASSLPTTQRAAKAFLENAAQSTSSTLLQTSATQGVVMDMFEGATDISVEEHDIQLSSCTLPQSAVGEGVHEDYVRSTSSSKPLSPAAAAVEVAAKESDFQSPTFSEFQNTSDDETIVDDETESTNGRIYEHDLDEYRRRRQDRRMEAYRATFRPQMLELAKYANDPLPERRQ